jgi:hypothetical protein
MRTRLCLILPVAVLVAGPAMAQSAVLPDNVPPIEVPVVLFTSPFPRVIPQYNTPGSELALPQPGDPVQQLSPLGTMNPAPGSAVVQLPPLGATVNPLQQTSPMGTAIR